MSDVVQYPNQWDVAFPLDERTGIFMLGNNAFHQAGVVVRRYTDREARFILRGDFKSENDLTAGLIQAEKLAYYFGCRFLTTQEKVDPQWLNALSIFKSQSFDVIDESWTFNGPFGLFADRSKRIFSVLVNKNVIPQDARVTNLVEGQEEVRALLNESLMMDDFEFDNRLKIDAVKSISLTCSQIAWHGKKIVGVLLVSPTTDSTVFEIPMRYVLPDYRQSWVNAQLIFAAVQHGEALGAKFIQFEANAKLHHETLLLAKKAGCERVGVFNRFEKKLASNK